MQEGGGEAMTEQTEQTEQPQPEPDVWGEEGSEYLYDSLGEAIAQCLEQRLLDIPKTLTMIGYRRMKAELRPSEVLERVLEELDEECANPENPEPTKPTPAMIEAAEAFCKAVLAEYVPWACEECGVKEVVDVREWARENDPELFATAREMEFTCDATLADVRARRS